MPNINGLPVTLSCVENVLSDNADTREGAFALLNNGVMGGREGLLIIIADILKKMINCNSEIQAEVLEELPVLLGMEASRELIPFLASPLFEIRALVTSLLYDFALGKDEVEMIAEFLCSEDEDVRSRAVELLVASGYEDLVFAFFEKQTL